jgi:hypothetical protein
VFALGRLLTERVYTLVCTVRLDNEGNRVTGCGRGWLSNNRTEGCPSCSEVGLVRDVYELTDLRVAGTASAP